MKLEKLIRYIERDFNMKGILCFFGWHIWTSLLSDLIDEFGYVPLDNRISSKAKCERCGKLYKDEKR